MGWSALDYFFKLFLVVPIDERLKEFLEKYTYVKSLSFCATLKARQDGEQKLGIKFILNRKVILPNKCYQEWY